MATSLQLIVALLIHNSLYTKTADLLELWVLLSPCTSSSLDTSCCPIEQKVISLFDISHQLGGK